MNVRIHNYSSKFVIEESFPMYISMKSIALLTPVFVTLFWTIILFAGNSRPRHPGIYIGILMLSFFVLFSSIIPYYTGNIPLYINLEPLFFTSISLIFPMVYFYIRAVTRRLPFRKKDIPHLLPAALFTIGSFLVHNMMSDNEKVLYAEGMSSLNSESHFLTSMVILNFLSKLVVLVQIFMYFILSERLIRRHKVLVNDYFSGLKEYYFNWIRTFYITYPGASVLGLYLLFSGNPEIDKESDLVIILSFFSLSAVFFLVAYIANHQRYIENGDFFMDTLPLPQNGKTISPVPAELMRRFDILMTKEKPYLNPDLKITDLASSLKTNRTYISQLIKDKYGTSFSGYINSCRIKESIRLFSEKEYRNYTTKIISEIAGFNNYNTFVSAFRNEEGLTPGKYRDNLPAG